MIIHESVFITLIAGYIGLVLGNLLLASISNFIESSGADTGMFKNPEINLNTALLSLVVLVITGILAGLIPARKASKVDPIVALHSE
jgi:putative ABC transport system permease protein